MLTKEKEEFMYLFEGAMSVIQETEEPEDDFTAKSSFLKIMKAKSILKAKERSSRRSLTQKFIDTSTLSPRSVMIKIKNCPVL